MPADKQDANRVGFFKSRETSLGVLPAAPYWQTREPNSFDDLGGEYTKVARRPFSPSRQRKKGSTVDLDATGGYNEDVTQNNLNADFEDFFFAATRKTPESIIPNDGFTRTFTVIAATDIATLSLVHGLATGDGPFFLSSSTTLPAGLAAATPYWIILVDDDEVKFATTKALAIALTAVDITTTGTGVHTMVRASVVSAAADSYLLNSLSSGMIAGSIIRASGFSNAANNGIKPIVSVTASTIVVADGLVDEAAPPYGAKVKVVGHQFAATDVALALITGGFTLTTIAGDFRIWNLTPGSWVFIGGDAVNTGFTTTGMYARIANNGISANGKVVTFDKSTATPVADPGTGKTIRIYFSDALKNEGDPDLITRYSSTMERTLGRDDDGIQSEYITGAVASELTWTSPLANLVNVDLTYVAQKAAVRTGLEGPLTRRALNTILPALGEEAFNTSSNIYRLRMGLVDPLTLNPTALFARVTEWSMTINNNVSSAKAQGVLGGFDTIVGNFDVEGSFTAYFSTVEAIKGVQNNYDLTFDAIYAKGNAGVYLDVPLVAAGGGRLTIEQDAAIVLPIEMSAAESAFGHTALVGWFSYLPTVAMPA